MKNHLNIIIERDQNGYYAYVPELKGCQSEGDTFDEARANIDEAIELYLETMSPNEIADIAQKETFITSKELKVA